MNKKKNLAEIYLNRNLGDPIFEKAKEVEESCNKSLKKEINKLYWNSYSDFKSLLGMMNKYYDKGFTLTDYYVNICSMFGKGNLEDGIKIFNDTLTLVAEDLFKRLYKYADVTITEIKHIIIVQTLYKTYLGFLFEEYIKELLESEEIFNVEQSESLDRIYKIDLLISLKEQKYSKYAVGLQLKSYTFETIYRKYKQKYLDGNNKAVNKEICKDVVYLLHNNKSEPLKGIRILQNKEHIFNGETVRIFGDDWEVAEGEELINELLKLIFEWYNEENKKDISLSLQFTADLLDNNEEDFEEFKKSIYKTEKSLLRTAIQK